MGEWQNGSARQTPIWPRGGGSKSRFRFSLFSDGLETAHDASLLLSYSHSSPPDVARAMFALVLEYPGLPAAAMLRRRKSEKPVGSDTCERNRTANGESTRKPLKCFRIPPDGSRNAAGMANGRTTRMADEHPRPDDRHPRALARTAPTANRASPEHRHYGRLRRLDNIGQPPTANRHYGNRCQRRRASRPPAEQPPRFCPRPLITMARTHA